VKVNNYLKSDTQNKKIKIATSTLVCPEEVLEPLPHPAIPKVKKYDYAILEYPRMTLQEIAEDYPDVNVPEEHKNSTVPIQVYARIDKGI